MHPWVKEQDLTRTWSKNGITHTTAKLLLKYLKNIIKYFIFIRSISIYLYDRDIKQNCVYMTVVACFIPQNITPGDYSNVLTSALQLSAYV